ncbi:MAG: RNA-binding S4 domain-containing protein [Lachnospiraceae bacterium]|nr:RNA-binding S4 domain-containing protein [Lachnospiraceae bacterium]
MEKIYLRDEYIKLGQALKLAGLTGSGLESKEVILDGLVKVNGEVDTRRGRKVYEGDVIEFEGEQILVCR